MFLRLAICVVCIFQVQGLALSRPHRTSGAAVEAAASKAERPCEATGLDPLPLKKIVMVAQLDSDFTNSLMFKNWFLYAKPHLEGEDVTLVFDTGKDQAAEAYLKDFDMGGLSYYTMHDVECRNFVEDLPSAVEKAKADKTDALPLEKAKSEKSDETVIDAVVEGADEAVYDMMNGTIVETVDDSVGPYGSSSYRAMMQRRPWIVRKLLERGHDVFQYDVDTVWLKSPFDAVAKAGTHDLYDTWDGPNQFCGCFLYFRQTEKSMEFAKAWADSIGASDKGNQRGLNVALFKNMKDKKVDVHTFERGEFPDGKMARHKGKLDPVVYHANFMRGVKSKVLFFKKRGLWKA